MKTFYDIHTHAFDLSHPNLSVFLQREDIIDSVVDNVWTCSLKMALPFAPVLTKSFIKKFIHNKIGGLRKQINNTLSFFEIPMEYQFLIMEYFLRKGDSESNSPVKIGDETYNKIALCPLIIDFGRKDIEGSEHYNLTPKTPVASQTGDLLYAIRTYFRFNIEVDDKNRMHLVEIPDWANCKEDRLFRIYPFMGIDTRNYSIEDIEQLLDKYFKDFSRDETASKRKARLFAKMGLLDGNLYRDLRPLTEVEKAYLKGKNIAPDYQNAFAGIKVYPQLGFDPWPDDTDERDKVNCLYKYCIDRRIPITTHCGDSGYKPKDNNLLTTPMPGGQWAKVLAEKDYAGLTLNFAHFGSQGGETTLWRDAIINLVNRYDNVYTDISCKEPKYYPVLGGLSNANPTLKEKVLFGSDFSFNMLVSNTNLYNDNLDAFGNAPLDPEHKTGLCERNPERFLFGGK